MGDLKETIAAGLQVARAAVSAADVIRKAEHDLDMAARPTAGSVASSIGEIAHDPVTVTDSNSIDLSLSGQALSADLKLSATTVIQAAGGPDAEQFSDPVVAGDVFTLSKQNVIRNTMSVEKFHGAELLYTGSEGTDYLVGEQEGAVYLLAGTGLATAVGDTVYVTYFYNEILDGPALVVDENGTRVDLGTAHGQAARGDHRHDNDHFPATGESSDTVTVTVAGGQVVSAEVRIDPFGSLDETASGLKVKDNQFSPLVHTHPNVTGSTPGFMTATDKTRLDTLWSEEAQQFVNTSTVTWSTTGSTASANVRFGVGLKDVGNGVEVDFSTVQAAGAIGGYSLTLTGAVLGSTANSTSYYVGADNGQTPSGTISAHDLIVPKTGTITRAFVKTRVGTPGSSEYVPTYIRKNDASNTVIGSTPYDSSPAELDNHAMTLAVTAGDRIALLNITPAWVTKPQNVQWWCQLWIQ